MDEIITKEHFLRKNKCHILRMPNNKNKVNLLASYFSLFTFQNEINSNDYIDESLLIDCEFTGKYERYIWKETSKLIDELEKNAEKLQELFKTIINTYKEQDFCQYQYIPFIRVNSEKMDKALDDFLGELGDDVQKIFHDMINGKNILLVNKQMDRFGYSLDTSPIDNSCIMIKNIPNCLEFYITLAHEMGHCYQFYLQKNQRANGAFDPYCEITSILFEMMFIEYLKTNQLIESYLVMKLSENISYLNIFSISKALCKLLITDKKMIIDPFSLKFESKVGKEEINKEIKNDCGYIKPFDIEPTFVEIHYAIGYIIAMNFMEKLKGDFETEWKNFKNFICSVNYLTMEEVIEKYMNIDFVQEDIKKLCKSYRER